MVVKSTIDAQLLQHNLDYLVKIERENGKSVLFQTNVASYLTLEMENISNLATSFHLKQSATSDYKII